MSLKNFTVSNPTPGVWVPLVKTRSIVRSLIVVNNGASSATVQLRLTNGPNEVRAIIMPLETINASGAKVIDLGTLSIGSADQLQVNFSAASMDITASGEIVE